MSTDHFLPDDDTFVALAGLPDGNPVVMLNLLEFADDGGESYRQYGAIAMPQIEKRGGRILYTGVPLTDEGGGGHWDVVILVEYPSRAAFLDMMADPDYKKGLPFRAAGLKRTVLYAFGQADNPMAPPIDVIPTDGSDEIFVLNLLRFKPEGKAEYQKYAQVVGPMIAERGGRPALVLDAELPLVSEETWEDLYLVRYPELESLMGMVATDTWQQANEDRQRGLDLTWAFPTRPARG
jgi:uncharacterized protein (DUF1330 family)